jgi:hypothetical protein
MSISEVILYVFAAAIVLVTPASLICAVLKRKDKTK